MVSYPDSTDLPSDSDEIKMVPTRKKESRESTVLVKGYEVKRSSIRFLESIKHLGGLDEKQWAEFLDQLSCFSLKDQEFVFAQGDSSEDGLYIVLSGCIGSFTASDESTVIREEGEVIDPITHHSHRHAFEGSRFGDEVSGGVSRSLLLCQYRTGSCIGESAILSPCGTRCVSAAALEDTVVLRFDSNAFAWLKDRHPRSVAALLLSTVCRHWRVSYFALVDLLSPEEVWSLVSDSRNPAFSLENVRSCVVGGIQHFRENDAIYNEGEKADTLFIVMSGEVETRHGALSSRFGPGYVCFLKSVCISIFT